MSRKTDEDTGNADPKTLDDEALDDAEGGGFSLHRLATIASEKAASASHDAKSMADEQRSLIKKAKGIRSKHQAFQKMATRKLSN